MLRQVIGAGSDLLNRSNAAGLCGFASDPKEPASPSPASIGRGAATQTSGPTKVLIVEDEALVALDICDFLSHAGYEMVGLAATEQDAVRMAAELRPDLIIMDLRLKHGGDGLRASQIIYREKDTPVLYITAYKNQETLERLGAQPSSHILFKPFAREALLEAVEVAMKSHGN